MPWGAGKEVLGSAHLCPPTRRRKDRLSLPRVHWGCEKHRLEGDQAHGRCCSAVTGVKPAVGQIKFLSLISSRRCMSAESFFFSFLTELMKQT